MLQGLPGFRDFYPEDCALRNHFFRLWRETARAYGFDEFDGPALEPLELFTRKSGQEIVSQLYTFEDRGGRQVALRPEMTPTLARMAGARAGSLPRPVKWFSIGENYRYERQQKGRLRAFYQLNADILGEPGPGADAEVIALLADILRGCGLDQGDFVIRLSDRRLWHDYLDSLGLDENAKNTVLGVVDKRERIPRDKALAGLQPPFNQAAAEDFLAKIEGLTGLRTLDELAAFMTGHAAHASIRERIEARLEDWRGLLGRLQAMGLGPFLRIDFGVVRGLAYYTGFVFEAFQTTGQGRALAGGGRYDHLVEKLGGPSLHATGFGLGDVVLRDLLDERSLLPKYLVKPDIFLVIAGEAAQAAALADARPLRAIGLRVEYALHETGFSKQFKQAGRSGAAFALIYASDELARGNVKARDLASRGEKEIARTALTATIPDLFAEGIPPPPGT